MINKVLPDTMRNMCLLLPLLTAGRYRYAELTPDYRLQVWDERKHGYVEKTLYSGGTQDQFSLALRLGFALAALPRELGTSPGFLFLDEPLSSLRPRPHGGPDRPAYPGPDRHVLPAGVPHLPLAGLRSGQLHPPHRDGGRRASPHGTPARRSEPAR